MSKKVAKNEIIKAVSVKTSITIVLWLLLLGASGCFSFYNLGAHSISVKSDEIVYVRVTQAMVHDGWYLQPKHGSVPFFNKPPLKMWLSSIPVFFLGESNFSFRFIDALSGVMVVLLTAFFGLRLFGSSIPGIMAGFFILNSSILFTAEHSFRKAVLEGVLVLFSMIGIWSGYLLCQGVRHDKPSRNESLLFGISTGAAVLVKSIAGYLSPVVVAAYLLFSSDRWTLLKKGRFYWLLSAIIAIILPALYFVPHSIISKRARYTFFFTEIYDRAVSGFEAHSVSYFSQLFYGSAAIPSILLTFGVLYGLCMFIKHEKYKLLVCWSLVPVILFGLSKSRVPWYLAPAIPGMALLAAGATYEAGKSLYITYQNRQAKIIHHLSLILFLFLVAGSVFQLEKSYRRIWNYIVTKESTRLPIDLAVEDMLSVPEVPVYIFNNAISGRSNPVNGKFNVDGIYREMLGARVLPLKNFADLSAPLDKPPGFLMIKRSDLSLAPQGYKAYLSLPPFHGRTEEVLVLAYVENELPHFVKGDANQSLS